MRPAIATLLLCALPVVAQAQTCTPTRLQYHSGWLFNAAYVYGPYVPEGEVWKIERGGVASNDSAIREIMFQVEERVVSQGNVCCWMIPVARSYVSPATPKSAVDQPLILIPGDRFSARLNATLTDLALLYTGWKYPLECLPRLLGMEAKASGTSGSGGDSPDLTAFASAARASATALNEVASQAEGVRK